MVRSENGTLKSNTEYKRWMMMDHNLAIMICSTISAIILLYVLDLENYTEIWCTIERRLKGSNRSRVIQLKIELRNLTMKNQTMTQYLTVIKMLVDNIAIVRAKFDIEDIILYTLFRLPPQYKSFKMAICTKLTPISLEDLYSLLISEEINVADNFAKETNGIQPQAAMYINK